MAPLRKGVGLQLMKQAKEMDVPEAKRKKLSSESDKLPCDIDSKKVANVLRSHRDKLSTLLHHDLPRMQNSLYTKSLIPRVDKSKTVDDLLNCIEDKIINEPENFNPFVDVLESEPFFQSTAKSLVESYLNSSGMKSNLTIRSKSGEEIASHEVSDPVVMKSQGEMCESHNTLIPPTIPTDIETNSGNVKTLELACNEQQDESPKPDQQKSYNMIYKMRQYQLELAKPGINGENYIIVAPTGSGKTMVAAHVISDHLKKGKERAFCHVIFVVQNRVLAQQQMKKLSDYIPDANVDICLGDGELAVFESIKYNDITVCTAGKIMNEIQDGQINFDCISLIVFDECHSTVGEHNYTQLMFHYFEHREKQGQLPQIIGMTASPGAGKNPKVDRKKTIDHLKNLLALLDASGGFKTVKENVKELHKFSKTLKFSHEFMMSREVEDDPVISAVIDEMKKLEKYVPEIEIFVDKWSDKYLSEVKLYQNTYERSEDETARDKISTLSLLACYSKALHDYMELEQKDAIKMIEDYTDISDDSIATPQEQVIKQGMDILLEKLRSIKPQSNSFLEKMKELLWDAEKSEPKFSRGMVFVRTKKYAYCLCDWVSKHPDLNAKITPVVLTGHTADCSMTQDKQKYIMDEFRKGNTNLLIATSVAEEGLDVVECNLVIRYHYVSNDISQRQAAGRARAENSQGFTICASDSKKKYKEMRNDELNLLVDEILKCGTLSTGDEIRCIQDEIIKERKQAAAHKRILKKDAQGKNVKLSCRKCKEFACLGSDIYKADSHYVVPDLEFENKFKVVEHHKRDVFLVPGKVMKKHKIRCKKCNQDWGITCEFRGFEGFDRDFPLLKCEYFNFKVASMPIQRWKQWKDVPFELQPLSTWQNENMDT